MCPPVAHDDGDAQMDERRGFDRRVDMLERQTNRLEMRVTLVETKMDGMIEMVKSRFTAMDRGHELILSRLEQLVPASVLTQWRRDHEHAEQRISALEDTKNQFAGAMNFAKFIGYAGIISGITAMVYAIVRLFKGTP